jgi:hypothetical protein
MANDEREDEVPPVELGSGRNIRGDSESRPKGPDIGPDTTAADIVRIGKGLVHEDRSATRTSFARKMGIIKCTYYLKRNTENRADFGTGCIDMGIGAATGYRIIEYGLFDKIDEMWQKVELAESETAHRRANGSDEPDYQYPTSWATLYRWYQPKSTPQNQSKGNRNRTELTDEVLSLTDKLHEMTDKLSTREQAFKDATADAERWKGFMRSERMLKEEAIARAEAAEKRIADIRTAEQAEAVAQAKREREVLGQLVLPFMQDDQYDTLGGESLEQAQDVSSDPLPDRPVEVHSYSSWHEPLATDHITLTPEDCREIVKRLDIKRFRGPHAVDETDIEKLRCEFFRRYELLGRGIDRVVALKGENDRAFWRGVKGATPADIAGEPSPPENDPPEDPPGPPGGDPPQDPPEPPDDDAPGDPPGPPEGDAPEDLAEVAGEPVSPSPQLPDQEPPEPNPPAADPVRNPAPSQDAEPEPTVNHNRHDAVEPAITSELEIDSIELPATASAEDKRRAADLVGTPLFALVLDLTEIDDRVFGRLIGDPVDVQAATIVRRRLFAAAAELSKHRLYRVEPRVLDYLSRLKSLKFWVEHVDPTLRYIVESAIERMAGPTTK